MLTSKTLFSILAAAVVAATPWTSFAGSVAGTGGSTEVTQIMNNGELVKVSMDSAQTASTTVQQYMTQLEQYRNQLQNTVGVDPATVGAEIRRIDAVYNQVSAYQQRLTNVQGSLGVQKSEWQQRADAARTGNMTMAEYLAWEKQKAAQGNQLTQARMERSKEVLDQTRADIQELNAARAGLPSSLGVNESIGAVHGVLTKVGMQNTEMIRLANEQVDLAADARSRQNLKDADNASILEKQIQMQKDLRNRQKAFANDGWKN